MTKKEKLFFLVQADLLVRGIADRRLLLCLDCILSMPDEVVDDMRSYHDYAGNVVSYFFGESSDCEANYQRTAKWIRRWAAHWTTKPASPQPPADPGLDPLAQHPSLCWTTDDLLVYTMASGGGLRMAGLSREVLVGKTVHEVFDTMDPDHWVLQMHYAALGGETNFRQAFCFGKTWHIVTGPRRVNGHTVGVDGAAIVIQPAKVPVGLN